jgi:glycosyltransferase involved in cell wall biosynthesis
LKLVIVHYHLRPGGIRRVIELAVPHIVRHFGRKIRQVVIATGEAADVEWNRNLRSLLGRTPVEIRCHPAFGYYSERKLSPAVLARRLRAALNDLLDPHDAGNCVVWAHNLGIARNLVLTRELINSCAARRITIVAHHHDWWFDNRRIRWPEMRQSGFPSLERIAGTVFPSVSELRHVAINQCDARILERHFPAHAGWLPNLTARSTRPPQSRQREARAWMGRRLGDSKAPVWILPCRLLRRKNVAEALLLTRWLRPEAWLVTTGGISSADETGYHGRLEAAGQRHRWRMRLGVLFDAGPRRPSVAELLAASEAVMLTSIQEGFGLPYLEAAAAGRPLIARRLPNIAPDLEQFGFRFPQYYDEVMVAPTLFDWRNEIQRQTKLFRAWKSRLPRECHRSASGSLVMEAGSDPEAVPFSRLTLTAQLEVLAKPTERSWELCAPLNPFLAEWKKRACREQLKVTPWPDQAGQWLGGPAYARRFAEIVRRTTPSTTNPSAGASAQAQFIHERLDIENVFPLLWARES